MNILLIRHLYSQYGVEGTLKIDGKCVCDTSEHPDHCLPLGTYDVKIGWDRRTNCKAPQLSDVAFLRAGNGPFGCTDGGIVVGDRLLTGVLINTAKTFEMLCARVKACGRDHDKVTLKIKYVKRESRHRL